MKIKVFAFPYALFDPLERTRSRIGIKKLKHNITSHKNSREKRGMRDNGYPLTLRAVLHRNSCNLKDLRPQKDTSKMIILH